jgi:hypothetical protein
VKEFNTEDTSSPSRKKACFLLHTVYFYRSNGNPVITIIITVTIIIIIIIITWAGIATRYGLDGRRIESGGG